jgi:two-component system phosphate regulon response regulator OmpR
MKVLIVDDEPDLREILREQLTKHDVAVLEAGNGLECLLQVKHEHPDVIVLDLTMPRLGGIEALKRIHKFDPRIRVLVLTASSDPVDHQAARSLGATEVFTKPYDLAELATTIAARGPAATS